MMTEKSGTVTPNTAAAPTKARSTDDLSAKSNGTISTSLRPSNALTDAGEFGERVRARTRYPASERARTTLFPDEVRELAGQC